MSVLCMWLVTLTVDLWPFISKINGFTGLIMEHLFCIVKSGNPSCVGFWDIARKNRHTDNYENPTPATVGLGDKSLHFSNILMN